MRTPAVPKADKYQQRRLGAWRMQVLPAQWNEDLQKRVLTLVMAEPAAKHPRTIEIDGATDREKVFLKVFHRPWYLGAVKEVFRISKGFRFWRQGLALSVKGFHAPRALAAGELRRFGLVQRSFVVTEKIEGKTLPQFLAALLMRPDRLSVRRAGIGALAEAVRRLHDCGFVHGDLVASNIFVVADSNQKFKFYFMDNDRTRRLPHWVPHSLWKRNLIQLNRLPLPGILLQDRMRFLRAYLGTSHWSRRNRDFARWIEVRTRERRRECDGAEKTSFRELMRWREMPQS
jgi:hypothetical protein